MRLTACPAYTNYPLRYAGGIDPIRPVPKIPDPRNDNKPSGQRTAGGDTFEQVLAAGAEQAPQPAAEHQAASSGSSREEIEISQAAAARQEASPARRLQALKAYQRTADAAGQGPLIPPDGGTQAMGGTPTVEPPKPRKKKKKK